MKPITRETSAKVHASAAAPSRHSQPHSRPCEPANAKKARSGVVGAQSWYERSSAAECS